MADEALIRKHFAEKSTPKITGIIKDEDGVVIPGASLDSLTLTLYNAANGVLLGARPAQQDIKGINGGSVDVNGNFALQLTIADMAIIDDTVSLETHIALIEWTYSTVLSGKKNIKFRVSNLEKVS